MNENAIQALLDYLNVHSRPPAFDWPRYWAEEVSFSRWAAEELLVALSDNPTVPAADTVGTFVVQMELYAAAADGRPASRIFSIAAETARGLLDML